MEIWRDIPGYEGLYKISNLGNVISLYTGNHLRQSVHPRGYCMVGLTKNRKQHTCKVHRLVASAFIPNPNNYPQVNHIDENKSNNTADNLEWCTNDYNTHYGKAIERAVATRYKKVNQYTLSGAFIRRWDSIKTAADNLGISASHISDCCKGRLKQTGGYAWKHSKDGD